MQPIAVAGAHLKVYINGSLFGTVTGMGFQIVSGHEERREVDNPLPAEIVPTIVSIQSTFQVVRIRNGSLEGQGIVHGKDIPRGKAFTFELLDRVTGRILFRAVDAHVTAQQWNVQAKGLMSGSFSVIAMMYANESNESQE